MFLVTSQLPPATPASIKAESFLKKSPFMKCFLWFSSKIHKGSKGEMRKYLLMR
jgi:hypothetical protein